MSLNRRLPALALVAGLTLLCAVAGPSRAGELVTMDYEQTV